jgi:predicted TIM-barrel fold metal-dependent hydrolase
MVMLSRDSRILESTSTNLIPYWDNEFPGNLKHLRDHKQLSDKAKRKILYENAKDLFSL